MIALSSVNNLENYYRKYIRYAYIPEIKIFHMRILNTLYYVHTTRISVTRGCHGMLYDN